MPSQTILHVTDLHIHDPKSTTEHLRTGYYDEYLSGLIQAIRTVDGERVDAIVATGDFVDIGLVENFPHAERVISYLSNQLSVPANRVVVCPGNHDILQKKDRVGELTAAREAYSRFAASTGNSSAIHRNDRGVLGKLSDTMWFLMLDSTLGADGDNRAGNMKPEEADEIMSWVKSIPLTDILLVGSHHPVDTYISRSAAFDDPAGDWARKHIWWDAAYLRERIKSERSSGFSIWLCGDIHRHGQFVEGGIAFCTAGRLGVTTSANHGEIRRQATLLQIEESQHIAGIRFEYEMRGGRPDAHVGDWKSTPVVFTRMIEDIPPFISSPPMALGDTEDTAEGTKLSDGVDEAIPPPANSTLSVDTPKSALEVIDAELQHELISTISSNELYRFGRFVTGGERISLSWVSIGPLLGTGNTLSAVVTKMASWIEARVLEDLAIAPENIVLLGTDCWGSVFASQISVTTGIRCYCTALRGDGAHSAPEEALHPELASEIADASIIILVTDVVASGRSLRWVYDAIARAAKKPAKSKWFALSLICDANQDRRDVLDFLESHGTLCADLRMPVLHRNQLPPEDVFTPTLSFG
jgi:pyrimidine operon attenuation protein/uracil phosphoribosyltransferase/predicted phosphodiesterase